MRPGLKPLAMGSVALVGASLIATTPVTPALTPPLPEHAKAQLSNAAVQLTGSVANIPTNLFRILMDMEKNQLAGLNAATDSLEGSGNWWIYGPTNALGWDHMDYAKAIGFTKLFTPIPEVAQAQADQLNAIMARNFPMTRSCTGIPGPCADPYYFTAYFSTPPWEAIFGYEYTFGDVFNSIDPSIEMPWSNTTVKYDPFGPGKALWEALTKEPEEGWTPERTYLLDRMEASDRFWKSVFNSFNPFVDGTYCLPCQLLGVKGAPSSLPVVNIFGNVYTILDFGQEFTDQDWSMPHGEVPAAPSLKKIPLFSAEAWERISRDAETYYNWVFKGGPIPTPELEEPHTWPAVPDNTPPVPQGLAADLPPKVLTVKGTEVYGINNILNKSVCDGSLGECENVEYIRWLQEASIRDGLKNLSALLADPESGPATVLGYSEGSVIASRWLSNYQKQLAAAKLKDPNNPNVDVEGSPDPEDLHFILTGNPNRKYGGTRPAWYIERATPNDTKYTVLDVAREYDGAADWPDEFNLLAIANAMSGYFVIHPYYDEVDLENDDKTVFQEGNTTYVLMRTENLPMLQGLRAMGLNNLADELQAKWKPIIDSAYHRDYPNVITDEAAAQEAVDRAKAGLPPLENTTTLAANKNALTADTKKVTDTGKDSKPALVSVSLPGQTDPKDDVVATPGEGTEGTDGTTGSTGSGGSAGTGGTGEQTPTTPNTPEAGNPTDEGTGENQQEQAPPKKNPFKPWGSSKQRNEPKKDAAPVAEKTAAAESNDGKQAEDKDSKETKNDSQKDAKKDVKKDKDAA